MENKIGEIVTLPFCDTKVRVEESPRYSNPLNLLISRCKGCYYENQEDVCEDYQDYGALGECYHICREDQKDIIFKPLSEDDNQSSCINQSCINQSCINQSCINQSCNQNTAPINHVKTIEERANEAGTISQYKSDYRYDKKSVEYGYIQGATEQKEIDEGSWLEKCKNMTQAEHDRNIAFIDWFLQNRKGTPTFSDAIEWAREDLLNEVCKQVLSLKQ